MNENREADKRRSGVRWIWMTAAAVFVVVLLGLGGLCLLLMPLIYPENLPVTSQTDNISRTLIEPPPPPPPPPPISSYQQAPAKISGHSSSQPLHYPKRIPLASVIVNNQVIQKTIPVYPPIARAARITGTVVLHAVISTSGSIMELRVVSGPAMLQQSALDAVKNWKYRPYLLNNEPVEVETTVNVIYTLGD
jgi:protein TonB